MRRLRQLDANPLAVYDAIVEAKNKSPERQARLRGLRDRVISCAYLRYYAHAPALERL